MGSFEKVFNVYDNNGELELEQQQYDVLMDYLTESFNSRQMDYEDRDIELEVVDSLKVGDKEELYYNYFGEDRLICSVERLS